MKKLAEVISRELDAAMRSGAFEVADVVASIREAEPEVVANEGDRLLDAALGRRIKDLLRDFEDDEENEDGRLFGLPRALAFDTPDGIRYIDTDLARWEHLKGAAAIRTANVTRAERRLNALERTMAQVEPAMTADNHANLVEAVSGHAAASLRRARPTPRCAPRPTPPPAAVLGCVVQRHPLAQLAALDRQRHTLAALDICHEPACVRRHATWVELNTIQDDER